MDFGLHGANPERFIKGKVYDFSTNTSVVRNRFSIKKKLASNYPTIDSNELKDLLPYKNKQLLFTNGINEAIYLIATTINSAAIVQPTYVEYERALVGNKKKVVHIQNIDEIEDVEAVFICNPNNPDGKVRNLNLWIKRCKEKGILLIVDESYKDFYDYVEKDVQEGVVYLRSLTKIYHMAGLRLGYVLASEEFIRSLNNIKPTWSVNAYAQYVGIQLLSQKKLLSKTKRFYKEESIWFKKQVMSLGYTIIDYGMHYFLIEVEDDLSFINYMLKHRILVRHTRNFRHLDGQYIRVATRTRKENKYFIKKLKEIL